MDLWLHLVLTVWLAAISLVDLRTRRIPNALVLPPLAVALLWRLGRGEWAVLPLCAGLYLAWSARLLGGAGDAKLLMALTVLFPRLEYALVLALVVLAVALPSSLTDRGSRSTLRQADSRRMSSSISWIRKGRFG